jgi:hypothetical protein
MALSLMAVLVAASPVLAHHISGTVYCDQDLDGTIDAGDTPIPGIEVDITSLDVQPGLLFTQDTDGSGNYNIPLPARTDRYRVELVGLPGGFTVVIPGTGSYVIQIITQTSQDHADGVNFLVQGCAQPTTSTTTTTTTTTPPTTAPVCQYPAVPFLAAREGKINNDASVSASVGVNNTDGRLRLGKNVIFSNGTAVVADTVQIGNASSVFQVRANTLIKGDNVTIRGGTGMPTLPLVQPFCSLPPITCGTSDVMVAPGNSVGPLPTGTYGRLNVLNGGKITLAPGIFTFCSVKLGRSATVTTLGPAVINVAGNVVIGTASHFGPDAGTAPVSVNAAGKLVRVSQSAFANAAFVAPNARITFGRDSHLLGCYCTDREKSDKHITLDCPSS